MTPPTNTYTVTFSDAHSHSVIFSAIQGNANAPDGGKPDALLNAVQAASQALGSLTATDTLTVTVTQP